MNGDNPLPLPVLNVRIQFTYSCQERYSVRVA